MIDYKALIKEMMGKKRFVHSCNVADTCVKLAKQYGEDTEKAYIAGILHDIRKEVDFSEMKLEMLSSGYYIDPVELDTKGTWHGIAAAYFLKNKLGIEDNDILNAVRFHTVGRARMSKLEKIVYLGDLVSAERDYPDVEKFRSYALKDLDFAMFRSLRWSIESLIGKGNKVPLSTMEAYNYYIEFDKKK